MKNSISHGRKKREIGDSEIPEPVMQNGPLDYEELLQSFNDLPLPYMYQNSAEKRFLGESHKKGKLKNILTRKLF